MTDLLTPSDSDRTESAPSDSPPASPARAGAVGAPGDADAPARRSFRAATLDEAVAAARAEFGPDVELIGAHRVRRGGLGGFFATDLGVEIIAGPQRATMVAPGVAPLPSTPPLGVPEIQPVPVTDAVLPVAPAPAEVVTALDRLIQHAESVDRAIPVEHADRVPAMIDDLDPLWLSDDAAARAEDPGSFEAHLRTEMAAATTGPTTAARPMRTIVDRPPVDGHDLEDGADTTAEIVQPDPVAGREPAAALPIGEPTMAFVEPATEPIDEVQEMSIDGDADVTPASLAPPSALLNPQLASVDDQPIDDRTDPSIEELDALLREVGITLDAVDTPRVPAPITTSSLSTIEALTQVAAEQLLDGVAEAGRRSAAQICRLSVSVTAPDGTTVSVASDLSAPQTEPMISTPEAPPELSETVDLAELVEPGEPEDGDA